MVIYIDALFIINFIFDFFILKTLKKTLKRITRNKRIVISSLIGEISILFLIFKINYILLFILKAFLAIFMIIICFGYKDIKYTITNLSYFYMISIILGGFIYFLKEKNINYFLIIIVSPIILIIYNKLNKMLRIKIHNSYKASITFKNNNKILVNAYLDTGNNLIDPISKKPIIILDKRLTKGVIQIRTPIYVPIKVINNILLLKCIKIKELEVDNKKFKNILVGITDEKINFNGNDCLLNIRLWED